MRTIILYVIILIMTIVPEISWAQNNTSSPYSGFGIGELELNSGGRNFGMGSTGIATHSGLFLNTTNPAALTCIERGSFLMDMGINMEYTLISDGSRNVDVIDGNISWLQMGFPICKNLFAAIALDPKSSVGYNIYTTSNIEGTLTQYPIQYEGTGGLSETSFSLAWKVFGSLSLGMKTGYIWGNVAQTNSRTIEAINVYQISQEDNLLFHGRYYNAGFQYQLPITKKSPIVLGGTIGISSKLKTETTTTIVKSSSETSETMLADENSVSNMKLPFDMGIGLAISPNNKNTYTFDYKQSDWKESDISISLRKLNMNRSFRFGVELAPNYYPENIRQVVRYRFGARYETGYIKIFDKNISERAISLGVGLPLRKGKSYANISIEAGQRGTLSNNLIKENFLKMNVSFNLWDNWFIKRKYD